MQPGTVGAELGVFTGLFAEAILETVRPAVLHLVDPWWLAYGDLYPDRGAYTAGGSLPTHVAHEAAVTRTEAARGDCEVQVHVSTSADWLRNLPDASLEWAYVDSTHYYRPTLEELRLLRDKLRLTASCSGTTGSRSRATRTTVSSVPSTSSSARVCGTCSS